MVASNLFSNVPYVLVARHFVPTLAQPEYQWMGLAMTSTLAGNLTIVGSVANLIVLELAGPDGKIGFMRFLRYGAVITLATILFGFGVLLLEMRLGLTPSRQISEELSLRLPGGGQTRCTGRFTSSIAALRRSTSRSCTFTRPSASKAAASTRCSVWAATSSPVWSSIAAPSAVQPICPAEGTTAKDMG